MFCPKCGTENLDDGKFCRKCGANLVGILAVVDGGLPENIAIPENNKIAEIYSTGIRNLILGFGFGLTAFLVKSMPGDTYFWMLFLIPAFCLLASGISRIVKAEELKKSPKAAPFQIPTLPLNQADKALPPNQTDYVKLQKSIYKTSDLIERPPSVVENTTKLLNLDDK
jgi:zinc-ribbon domain